MCGIAGFSHMTDVTRRMIPYLCWEIESRGHDSWGATDGHREVKELGPVTTTLHRHLDEIGTWDRAIFHTRAGSTGSVTLPNQHPFRFTEGVGDAWRRTIVGIHNGIISNHFDLNRKYERSFDVDSMHIYAHLTSRMPMTELHGWGNLAWYEFNPEEPNGTLHLLRFNNDACNIARLETGELVFCSTELPVRRAARMAGSEVKHFYRTMEEYIYTATRADDGSWELYQSKDRLPFGTRGYTTVTETRTAYTPGGYGTPTHPHFPGRNGGGSGRYSGRNDFNNSTSIRNHAQDVEEGLCAMVGCRTQVSGTRRTHLICERHWKDAVTDAATRVGAGGTLVTV